MRKLLGVLVLAAAVVAAVSLLPDGSRVVAPGPGEPVATQTAARESRAARAVMPGETRADARARWLREQASARAELERRIVAATAARARQEPAAADAVATRPEAPAVPDEGAGGSGMTDRTGTRGYLMRVMNEDLIPLADECYELARASDPTLAGLLELELAIVGDEDVGGVVEAVEPGHGNAIADAGLIECVRESLLATTLPPPPTGGRDEIMLSLRFGPEA